MGDGPGKLLTGWMEHVASPSAIHIIHCRYCNDQEPPDHCRIMTKIGIGVRCSRWWRCLVVARDAVLGADFSGCPSTGAPSYLLSKTTAVSNAIQLTVHFEVVWLLLLARDFRCD